LLKRLADGRVRECHGDLHLGNIVRLGSRLVPFDCIEFSQELRTVDTMSDACFLEMDLRAWGLERYANRYLNQYLEHTGDYEGLALRRYFLVYRALVRAKVSFLGGKCDDAERYLRTASRLTGAVLRPWLFITYGLSGSGKSTLAAGLAEYLGIIRIRSDVERKRRVGMVSTDRGGAAAGLYTESQSVATYERLADLAREVLRSGYHVVIDASFLSRAHRALLRALVSELRVEFRIVHAWAGEDILDQRVTDRAALNQDASDASGQVLADQRRRAEPLSGDEREYALTVDTGQRNATETCVEAVRGLLSPGYLRR